MENASALHNDFGLFLKQVMAILASRYLTLSQKLDQSGQLIREKVSGSKGSIMLYDDELQQLKVVSATRQSIVGIVQDLSLQSISGYVCVEKKPLLIKDISRDTRFPCRSEQYKTSSLISVPLLSDQNQVIGVINISDKEGNKSFTQEDLSILSEYASWITPFIENLCIQDRLEKEKEKYRDLARELEIKQQELLIASTERSELVQMVVHDFKSPLSAIISNMDLLSYLGPSDSQKPIIETAFKGASKLLEMIDDFLHIARMDEWNERGMEPRPVDFYSLVLKQLEEINSIAVSKKITFDHSSIYPVNVWGDTALFGHLVQNLLSNAVKYISEGGNITIGMETWKSRRGGDLSDTVLKFFVEDNGEGIDDAYKEKIFDKFVRTKKSEEQGIKGTGIGLFICRKIVTMFKGKIWVEDAVPRGSRFCIILFVVGEQNG